MNIYAERIPFLNDFAVKEHPLMEQLAMRWRGKKSGKNCRRKCFEKKSFLFLLQHFSNAYTLRFLFIFLPSARFIKRFSLEK